MKYTEHLTQESLMTSLTLLLREYCYIIRFIFITSTLAFVSHAAIDNRMLLSRMSIPLLAFTSGQHRLKPTIKRLSNNNHNIFVHTNPIIANNKMSTSSRHTTSSHGAMVTIEDSSTESSQTKTIRILGLHGSGGNGEKFEKLLNRWKSYFQKIEEDDTKQQDTSSANINKELLSWDVFTIDAPVSSSEDEEYMWWKIPTGVRSFNAEEYEYYDMSEALVIKAIEKYQPDYIVGFSQGAILLTSLISLNKLSSYDYIKGCVLIGVAWPNPFTKQLQSLEQQVQDETTTINEIQNSNRNVLVVVGTEDDINPMEQSERVANALNLGGYKVKNIYHPKGHVVPISPGDTLDSIHKWFISSLS